MRSFVIFSLIMLSFLGLTSQEESADGYKIISNKSSELLIGNQDDIRSVQIFVTPELFLTKMTGTTVNLPLGIGKVLPWHIVSDDQLHPGIGITSSVRYNFKNRGLSEYNFWLESGVGFYRSSGDFILRHVAQDKYEIIGNISDNAVCIPLAIGLNTTIKNVPMILSIGRELFWLPKDINTAHSANQLRFRQSRMALIEGDRLNSSLVFDAGIRIEKFQWVESLAFRYQHSVKPFQSGNEKRKIGLTLKFRII